MATIGRSRTFLKRDCSNVQNNDTLNTTFNDYLVDV